MILMMKIIMMIIEKEAKDLIRKFVLIEFIKALFIKVYITYKYIFISRPFIIFLGEQLITDIDTNVCYDFHKFNSETERGPRQFIIYFSAVCEKILFAKFFGL
jgi:hypothetical protein